jgi:hypothetical protein
MNAEGDVGRRRRIMQQRSWTWIAGVSMLVVPLACQRRIVAVGDGNLVGGAGGGGAPPFGTTISSNVSTVVTIAASGGCVTPDPVGQLGPASTTVASSGSGVECFDAVEDEAGDVWSSECEAEGCSCRYDGLLACSCGLPSGTDCTQVGTCCPAPWSAP